MKKHTKEYRYYRKVIPLQYREQLKLTEYKISLKDIEKKHIPYIKAAFDLVFERIFRDADNFVTKNGNIKEYLKIEYAHMLLLLCGKKDTLLDKYLEVVEKESKLITLKQCKELYEKYTDSKLSTNYRSYYKKLIVHFGEDFYIQDLSEDNLYKFKSEALGKLGTGSYNLHLTFYSSMIQVLIDKKKLTDNPFTILNKATYNAKVEGFSNEEVSTLINNATGDIKTAIITQAFTGARIGEVLNIKISDIDTDKHSITIGLKNTITKKHKRDIPIHLKLQKYLYPLIKNLDKDDYLIEQKNRKEHSINTYIKNTLNGKKRSHSFKHSFIEQLQTKRPDDTIYIKILAAHSINDITFKRYGKSSTNWDKLVEVVESIDYEVA